jgi:hypothetical protein
VLAVFFRFTNYTTQLFTILYCRLHESVLQSLYNRFWPPDVVCRGGLLMSSLFEGWPRYYDSSYSSTICDWLTDWLLSLSLILRPTFSRPVCLGIKHPSGAYVQIFSTADSYGLVLCGAPSLDETTGLSFLIAAGPCQRSFSLIRVPWNSRPYFTVSDLTLPFSSPLTTRRVTVEVFDPASTRIYVCGPKTRHLGMRLTFQSQRICYYGDVFSFRGNTSFLSLTVRCSDNLPSVFER